MINESVRVLNEMKEIEKKLDLVAEYNSLYYLTREEVKVAVYWLIEEHYILKTKGQYPVLHITNEGLHYKEHITPRKLKRLIDILNSDEKRKRILDAYSNSGPS